MAIELPILDDVAPQQAQAKKPAAPAPSTVAAAFPVATAKGETVGAAAAGVQSEFGKRFARAMTESILSEQFGFPVHIPDEEEEAYQRAAKASHLKNITQQNAEDNATEAIRNTVTLLAQNPDALKAAGISLGSIAAEPEKFVAFANKNRLSPQPLTTGDLFQIGVGTQQFADRLLTFDPEARAAAAAAAQEQAQMKAAGDAMTFESKALSLQKERAQQPGAIAKADEETAGLVEEYMSGKGTYGPGMTEAIEGAEKAFTVRLGRTVAHPFDVQMDEARGPAALLAAYNAEQKRVGSRLGTPVAVSKAFEKKFGSELADQIEEIPLDEQGNILAGAGSKGVDPGASLGLTAMAMRLAKDEGLASVSDLFLRWGIKASGVNPESFVQQLLVESEKGAPQETLLEAAKRLQEYGLLDEFGPTLLSYITKAGSEAPKGEKP